jgi:Na+/glutamate symporter
LRTLYVLIIPDFVLSVTPLIYAAVEIGIGVFLIQLFQNNPAAASAYSNAAAQRPSIVVSILAAFLGILLGGVVGAVAGFGGGAAYAELTDMSCFEGACGYFAFFMGLFGIVIGAIAGGILAVWLVNRRRRPAAAVSGVSN